MLDRAVVAVATHINNGDFKPVIAKVLPYVQIAEGHRILEKGGMFGKVVLKWK